MSFKEQMFPIDDDADFHRAGLLLEVATQEAVRLKLLENNENSRKRLFLHSLIGIF